MNDHTNQFPSQNIYVTAILYPFVKDTRRPKNISSISYWCNSFGKRKLVDSEHDEHDDDDNDAIHTKWYFDF